MDKDFQDRIDDYICHRMSAEEIAEFEALLKNDPEKQKQLEMTRQIKKAISSRQEKLQQVKEMEMRYQEKHAAEKPVMKRIWPYVTGIAAIFVLGYFVIYPSFFVKDALMRDQQVKRGNDKVFTPSIPQVDIEEYYKFDSQPLDSLTNPDSLSQDSL